MSKSKKWRGDVEITLKYTVKNLEVEADNVAQAHRALEDAANQQGPCDEAVQLGEWCFEVADTAEEVEGDGGDEQK